MTNLTSIRVKIIAAFLFVSILGILTMGYSAFQFAESKLIETRGENLLTLAIRQKTAVRNVIQAWKERVRLIASRTQLKETLKRQVLAPDERNIERIGKILRDAMGSVSQVRHIAFCNLAGRPITSVGRNPQGGPTCLTLDGKSKQALQLQNIGIDHTSSKLYLHFNGPIILDGEVISIIQVVVDARELVDVINDYTGFSKTGETLLARRLENGDAQFIHPLRYNKNANLTFSVSADKLNVPITQALLKKEEFFHSEDVVDYRGKPVLAATAYIPEVDWGVVAKVDRDDVLQPVAVLLRVFSITALAVIAVVIVCATIFSGFLTRPILQLASLAESFPKIDNIDQLAVDKNDEIGVLSRSFLKLTNQVSEQNWLQDGQLNIVTSLRANDTINETAYNALKALCVQLDVPLGAFYLVNPDSSLKFLEGYAVKGNVRTDNKIAAADTILSTCIEDGVVKVDNDLPDDYFYVQSGLGKMRPSHRLIAPVSIERNPLAVIEIAGNKPFTDMDVLLVERVLEAIGLAVTASTAQHEIKSMLEESKVQQEELIATNSSLESKTRELEESQDELAANYTEMESKNQKLRGLNQYVEDQAVELKKQMIELERASKYKSEFMANMSHELRTPLNSLLILAKTFQENEDGNLTEEQVEEATMIYNGGVELLNLISDVLDFSKIEAGKISIVKSHEPVDLMVKKLVRQFMPLAKQKNLYLESHIDDACPETVYTDGQRVEQILKNLIANAIKFTENGGVKIDVTVAGDKLAFAVADTGIGIREEKRSEIFEAFKQEDGSIDRKYGGTGLGLSISSQLSELLDGAITLESETNVGSTFTLMIPLVSSPENVSDEAVMKSTAPSEVMDYKSSNTYSEKRESYADDLKTILIVEDDLSFAKTLARIAEKRGYETVIATNGKDALIRAETVSPHAIILDLMLPDINGLKVLDLLKGNIKTRHIPVHIVSAREIDEHTATYKGAIGYLSKPLTSEDVDSMFASVANIHQASFKQVLVVEDDVGTQTAIKKLLQSKEMNITVVENGGDGISALKNQDFDCIILDLQLPDTTGLDFLRKVTNLPDVTVPPVIIYTARKLTIEETQALEEFTGSIIIKGAHSPERLVDEVSLFLHSVEDDLSEEQRNMLIAQNNPNQILEQKKVLLVDDDMRNIYAMSKKLKKYGMNVVVAENGKKALDKLEQEDDVSLVIMDIMMPVMDGYETTRAIRQHSRYSSVPVIALTARTMPDEKKKCLEAGANDYLAKPVDIDMLMALMRVLLFNQSDYAQVI